jgi:adenylosuccinate lyase
LALTQAGMSRESAYETVQRHAMATWREGGSFEARLAEDPDVDSALPGEKLSELFDLGYHLKEVDTIFERVFAAAKPAISNAAE